MLVNWYHGNHCEAFQFSSKWKPTAGGYSIRRRLLLLFLLLHATNLFLCGPERVKWLSSDVLGAFIQYVHSSPPLHVPYSLQQRLLLRRTAWWVGWMPAKEAHRSTPSILSLTSAPRCCNTTAYPRIQVNTYVMYMTVTSQETTLLLTSARWLQSDRCRLKLH